MPTNARFITFWAVILLLRPASLEAAAMHCATVGPTGDVTITWDTSGTIPGNFRSWHVYHSSLAAGPFTLIDSVNTYLPPTFNDPLANAATIPAFYYVIFQSSNGSPSLMSDTIRAIGMLLNNAGTGIADLRWNPTHNPPIATNNPYYLIYKEYPAGVFTLLDSIDVRTSAIPMSYADTITICDDTIRYRIDVADSSGCISSSFVKADRFHDVAAPAIPVIDSVSVDASGIATVAWQVSISNDTRSYVVLQIQMPLPIPVDTVIGINSTFLNTGINATGGSESFLVFAIDSCGNRSAVFFPHSTIHVSLGYDPCAQSTMLNWTPYDFWGTQPMYDVLLSINGAPETVIGTVSQTSFVDTNLISGSVFCYRIRAIETGGVRTSTSNQVCMTPNFPPPPSFSFIRSVTVSGTDQIEILAFVDSVATITGYQLYRSLSPAGPFTFIQSQNISGVGTITFFDQTATDQGPYYYFITTIDSCGLPVISSQVSNTILLDGYASPDLTNSLNWTPYGDWPTGVDHYNIYRSSGGIISPLPIVTLTGSSFNFIDSVIGDFFSGGEFCYIIEAIESPGDPDSHIDTSHSNEICLHQEPIIFIPNAFNPAGAFNKIFLPSNSFVSPEGYSFDIYNRWGEIIFHTNDPTMGWDGTSEGKDCQEAVYVYRLVAKNGSEGEIERVGSVTLIR